MVDLYLQNRSLLNGQPKRTIADYVEKNGILVPRRFNTLQEARQSGLQVLCRSEHVQEYDGVSGLLQSKTLDELPDTDEEGLRNELLKEDENKVFFPRVFCSYSRLDLNQFLQEVSFSYWEKLGGRNRTVVADSSIKGKYHILTNGEYLEVNYAVLQEGRIIASAFMKNPAEYLGELRELVSLYEKVRDLDNFDQNHCPVMEFQTVDGKHYFLQYHRTRDFRERGFQLERQPEADEVKVAMVRGATPSEGIVCKTTMIYAKWITGRDYEDWPISEHEDGSVDIHYNRILTEVMSRRRKLQVLSSSSLDWELVSLAIGHTQRSQFFKPEISVIIPRRKELKEIIRDEEWNTSFKKARETGEDQYVTLRIISDGENAYVKRLD